jgi:hypothetical protein
MKHTVAAMKTISNSSDNARRRDTIFVRHFEANYRWYDSPAAANRPWLGECSIPLMLGRLLTTSRHFR